jgi:hypothetical protein
MLKATQWAFTMISKVLGHQIRDDCLEIQETCKQNLAIRQNQADIY